MGSTLSRRHVIRGATEVKCAQVRDGDAESLTLGLLLKLQGYHRNSHCDIDNQIFSSVKKFVIIAT